MNLKVLQKNWNEFGKIDPLWAIMSLPDKKGNKWQTDEFFATGIKEIDSVMKYAESLGIQVQGRKALDFGCGVGRLTQALAHYFGEVCGVDIAPSMIELARKYNRYGDKCKYCVNDMENLRLFHDNTFDFIYSNIALQHIGPKYSKMYIKEFLRVLAPHGLLIFQLPSEPTTTDRLRKLNFKLTGSDSFKHMLPTNLIDLYYKMRYSGQPIMEMFGIRRDDVVNLLEKNKIKVKIKYIEQNQNAGKGWVSFRYFVTKE